MDFQVISEALPVAGVQQNLITAFETKFYELAPHKHD
jgi:hypothetical protein